MTDKKLLKLEQERLEQEQIQIIKTWLEKFGQEILKELQAQDGAGLKEKRKMKKIKVHYQAAEGRHTNQSVDYMLALVDGVELYAETPTLDDECGTYEDLREQILEQARGYEINHEKLEFWFDS